MNDVEAMRLALELAQIGEGDVNPNPLVGCVIVKEERIVGRGYHRHFGGPHAEVFALDEAGDDARDATLFVTLEPCCHHGKTPPCTDRIIDAGVARVVFAVRDPNPAVNGNGAAALIAAGIDAEEGVLREEAAMLNEIFFTFAGKGRPFVLLKAAISLDGNIATRSGDSKWISGEASRTEAHRLRRRFASILIGVSTLVADDPELSVRRVPGRDPVPIVLDPHGRTPDDARLLAREPFPIIVTSEMTPSRERALASLGARIWRLALDGGRLALPLLLNQLTEAGIDSVLVEGGGETAAAFLEADLVDKLILFIAPILIGGRESVSAIGGQGADRIADAWRLHDVSVRRLADDICVTGYPDHA
ncbi:MAG: bifunctional diaminohydroxyphosphoribosylaminopyrimidine deaminase/5-amino-6-(5-phosphoribosylamino)uracil reductase RibD [Candidatus Bipolaricaulia bacterium]